MKKNVKIIIFLFSPFKSPPEGVWKIDPKVKNGPLGQIWKNHKFYEISFSPIKSPPEGSEKSTQRSKMIKNVKIKTKIEKMKFFITIFCFLFSPIKAPPEGVWKIDPKDQKLAFDPNLTKS